MGKLLLNSVMLGTVALPVIMALRLPANAASTRKVIKAYFAFAVAYVLGVLYVLPRLGGP